MLLQAYSWAWVVINLEEISVIELLGGPLTLAEKQLLMVSGFLLAIFSFGKYMEYREVKKEYENWKNNRIRNKLLRKRRQRHLEVPPFSF